MKYIKLFENFKGNSYLEKELNKYGIKNYTINDDGTIDVNGDVFLWGKKLIKIPFNFSKVTGHFNCANNYLISLEGSPQYIDGSFSCNDNKLKSLIGGPIEVGESYYCDANNLNTLNGMALEIGCYSDCSVFRCYENPDLKKFDSISNIEGDIICDRNIDMSTFKGYCKNIEYI